jgi:WXG100 family type VII secretion target
MAIKEIEQNTDYLADDISRLEQEKTILEQAIDEMFAAVRDLDSTWEGPAKAAFVNQFQVDYNRCKEMNNRLASLIEKLETARNEYDKCENEVGDIVRSIRI